MNCQVREDLSPELLAAVYNSQHERFFCGKAITSAMKDFCSPIAVAIIQGRQLSKRSGEIFMNVENMILIANFFLTAGIGYGMNINNLDNGVDTYADNYQDEALNDVDNFGYDMFPRYLYNSKMFKRHQGFMTITQACCKKPCPLTELIKYCPPMKKS